MRKPLALALLCLALSAPLAAFPFWLPSAKRTNPLDPQNPNHLFPTATPLPPMAGPTNTNTPSNTPTNTATAVGTPTNTSTYTPTFTPTPTPLTWYTGESAPFRLQDLVPAADTAASGAMGFAEVSGGAGGSGTALAITFSATANTWYGRAVLGLASGALDVSSANTLDLYVRVPAGTCGTAWRPTVQLRTNAGGVGWPNDRSASLTVTAYLAGGSLLPFDQWTHVQIPLSAFVGPNPDGGSFAAAGLGAVTAVVVGVWSEDFDATGAMPAAEVDVDSVTFINLGSPPSQAHYGLLFDDFEVPGRTAWGTQEWEFDHDTLSCAPVTSASFPTCNGWGCRPVDTGGNSLTACHAGHMAGFQGDTSSDCPVSSGNWALVRMMVDFMPTLSSTPTCSGSSNVYGYTDLSNNTVVGRLPAGGATGLQLRLKRGTAPNTGQLYTVQILRLATACSWDNYEFAVADSSLSSSWTTFRVDFPADGTAGTLNQHSLAGTELWWGQPTWATPVNWARNDFCKLIIRVMNGGSYELWVDDIEFY